MMSITDVMRAPAITVGPNSTLSDAVTLMVEHGVTELPVVDAAQNLIGIVGEADLYRARLSDMKTHLGNADSDHPYDGRVVSDLMRRPVIFVEATDTLMLCQQRLMGLARSLPVLDGRTVVGLVDRKSLLAVFARNDAAVPEQLVGPPSPLGEPETDIRDVAAHVTAEMVMSRPVITVTQDQTLADVWSLMSSRGIRHIAVLADTRCIGVIDDRQIAAKWPEGPAAMKTTTVSQLLGRRVAGVGPHALLSEAAAILKDDGAGAVPVVDEHGALLGLVTAVDIVQAVARWDVDTHTVAQPVAREPVAK